MVNLSEITLDSSAVQLQKEDIIHERFPDEKSRFAAGMKLPPRISRTPRNMIRRMQQSTSEALAQPPSH
jgi:hypothetical protein